MKKLNCYKTVKWILSALPFFLSIWNPTCLCAIQRFHRAACAGTVQIWKGLGFPNKYFAEQNSRLQAQRSNESPSGAFKRRSGLAQQDGGALPRQARLTMRRMQTMQGKTRLSRRCAKSVQKCAEPQKMENPTRNRKFIRIIARFIFAHTALFAYSAIICNGYPAIQACKKCAKMCRRAKQSPMDKSITGFMAGFRTTEQTPFDIEMRFTMNKLLSCRHWEKNPHSHKKDCGDCFYGEEERE